MRHRHTVEQYGVGGTRTHSLTHSRTRTTSRRPIIRGWLKYSRSPGAELHVPVPFCVQRLRGGSRDTSETDSRNSRTNQEPTSKRQKNKRQLPKGSKDINPTSPPTDPHAHAPNCTRHRPHANPGTHASPQYKHEPPPDKFRSSTLHPSFHRSTPGLRLFLRLLSRSRFSCGFVSLGLGEWL